MLLLLVCLSLIVAPSFALSNEQVASRRQSTRSYSSTITPRHQLLDVLRAAYGYTAARRNTPKIGSGYSLVIYALNQTGSYRYIPESNSLVVHDLTANKQTNGIISSWVKSASDVLVIVWNETAMSNSYFAAAEAGCFAQNVYLAAASLDLGTCVVGQITSGTLRSHLNLASTMHPMYVMPVGDPTTSYTAATPKYSTMNGNLPQVQNSIRTFEESINNIAFAQEWSEEPLSTQIVSQLLWAAYGYSSTDHRTVPSAMDIYPLVIYVSNATGIYQYSPESHSVTQIVSGDERYNIANALSGQVWAADAPALFIIGCDTAYNGGSIGDGGSLDHMFIETDAGCVVQQLFLEAATWNLKAGIVSDAAEEWGGSDAQEVRSIMGLSTSIIPLYAVSVGMSEGVDNTPPAVGVPSQNPAVASVEPEQSVTVSVEVTDGGVGVSGVVLSYSIDGGQTWTDTAMPNTSADVYSGEISGFEEDKNVQYKILAYDNNGNLAVEDNSGNYYSYTVIPELQSFLAVIFFISATLAIILMLKKKSWSNGTVQEDKLETNSSML
jgi:hypothetical protein